MKILLLLIISLILIYLVIVILLAFYWGAVTPFTNPSGAVRLFGKGEPMTYVVLGDSLAAGQGGDYERGIAVTTAKHLAKNKSIAMYNFSVSGATVHDVLTKQLAKAIAIKPDIVLISVGGNDVIQRTSLTALEKDLDETISRLIRSNCSMKLVVTGSPDVGTVKRFFPPLSWLASFQSARINEWFTMVVKKYAITYADVFSTIGPLFRDDKTLYAGDNFHPNDKGYVVWNTALSSVLDQALHTQPSHCSVGK